MKRKTIVIAAISALVLGSIATVAIAQDRMMDRSQWCENANGMGGGYGMKQGGGHGPMGGGYGMKQGGGYGPMGGHHMGRFMKNGNFDLDLTPERVKEIMEGRIAWMGNENLKVGDVTTDADGNIQAQLVTKDNSLVETFKVDPKTGAHSPVR